MAYRGIDNVNEFYSQHYIDEVLPVDIKNFLAGMAIEKDTDVEEKPKDATPWRKFKEKLKTREKTIRDLKDLTSEERNGEEANFLVGLVDALGLPIMQAGEKQLLNGVVVPLLSEVKNTDGSPYLWVLHASPSQEELNPISDSELSPLSPLEMSLTNAQKEAPYEKSNEVRQLESSDWSHLLNNSIFAQSNPPRWILLASMDNWILIDRAKFQREQFLRFRWREITNDNSEATFKAIFALLSLRAFAKESAVGFGFLEGFDENSYRHAYGVSKGLKYSLRESIELLGNEATSQLLRRKHFRFTADELSDECLRYMYRLLFLFFVESRPDLNYAPLKDSAYMHGYSLERLRDMELTPLSTEDDTDKYFLDRSIRKLFKLYANGTKAFTEGVMPDERKKVTAKEFEIAPLRNALFDDKKMPLLLGVDKEKKPLVKFSDKTLQKVIQLMSLSREEEKGKKKTRGRISYAQLGLNQLGEVYEALLSYRGFIADRDLYEVKKANEAFDILNPAYFVEEKNLETYNDKEKVYVRDPLTNENKLKLYPKGTFIYRMTGRQREESASYYTPEVLTRTLVSEALSVLKDQQLNCLNTDKEKAEKILNWKICEPAMGSAAFLNEAINQCAALYMEYARKDPEAKKLDATEYLQELQKVKMFIADNNIYGVDLNPVAVELAQISIWLNVLSNDRHVPWFGFQFACGNSLIGCRREAYFVEDLKGKNPLTKLPHKVGRDPLKESEIWNFLVLTPEMASYDDKVARKLYPEAFQKLAIWRKSISEPYSDDDLMLMQDLSQQIDTLWNEWAKKQAKTDELTSDSYPIYGHEEKAKRMEPLSYEQKEEELRRTERDEGSFGSGEFARLKMVMDYWCSLWFWPISAVDKLPKRWDFLMHVYAILQGINTEYISEKEKSNNSEKLFPKNCQLSFTSLKVEDQAKEQEKRPQASVLQNDLLDGLEIENPTVGVQQTMFNLPKQENLFSVPGYTEEEIEEQNIISIDKRKRTFAKRYEQLRISFNVTERMRFLHWELQFPQIFLNPDKNKRGFDLIVCNPPWRVVQWNSRNVVSTFDPIYEVRNKQYIASHIDDLLLNQEDRFFDKFPLSEEEWITSLSETQGMQNFLRSAINYSQNETGGTDLFKYFITKSWSLSNKHGVEGILHPETVYTETKGGSLREKIYKKIRTHLNFVNERKLFPDVGHTTEFSINVYGISKDKSSFSSVSSLYHPSDLKKVRATQKNRIINFNGETLLNISKIFGGKPGSPILPSLPINDYLPLLTQLLTSNRRLGKYQPHLTISRMWDETEAVKAGFIKLYEGKRTNFPNTPEELILNGPHIWGNNPLYKCPNDPCPDKSAWKEVNLNFIDDEYLPRTKFRIPDKERYRSNLPKVNWPEIPLKDPRKPITDYYRIALRGYVNPAIERTLIPAIISPGVGHIDSVPSICFRSESVLLLVDAYLSSIILDFYVRLLNKKRIHPSLIKNIPLPETPECFKSWLRLRVLALNSLSSYYTNLWENNWSSLFKCQSWGSTDPHLNHAFFKNLKDKWSFNCSLKIDLDRRQAQLEIDVMTAISFGFSVDDLLDIYENGFSVMKAYEESNFYDQVGQLVYTDSKGLPNTGLPQQSEKKHSISYLIDGQKVNSFKFLDVKDKKEGTVSKIFNDTTQPGNPEIKITYVAPFFKKDRIKDYKEAWNFFEKILKENQDIN